MSWVEAWWSPVAWKMAEVDEIVCVVALMDSGGEQGWVACWVKSWTMLVMSCLVECVSMEWSSTAL